MSKLLSLILDRAYSQSEPKIHRSSSLTSPPPEVDKVKEVLTKRKRRVDHFKHVPAKVDTSPPPYTLLDKVYRLKTWKNQHTRICHDNIQLLADIRRNHFTRGKVDSRWKYPPQEIKAYYKNRVNFMKNVARQNRDIYNLIITARPKVQTAASLKQDWKHNRANIIQRAQGKFVLFPVIPQQEIEDPMFVCPAGVKRPRVYVTLRIKNHALLGTLAMELFTDVCPDTCKLFLDLLDGDGVGYGYVGTQFFRKVPGLFWRGGDVVYNNGFGCYAQKGRCIPIGAENFHFPHSMSGLLSMSVTKDDEMCGIFNITFKPILQFDLHHVVFGRVIRPSAVFSSIVHLGSSLSTQPVIEIVATKRKFHGQWIYGTSNKNMLSLRPDKLK